MSEKIRLPGINAESDKEKLQQIRSYLYQLADQLNRTLDALSVPAGSTTTEQVHLTFSRLRPLIMESSEIADAYAQRLRSIFVTRDSVLHMKSYSWTAVADMTVQSYPASGGAGDPCQNFLVFGHSRGSAFLECWVMIGKSSLLQTGGYPARLTEDGRFVIPGVPGDRITILSDQPFTLG